MLPFRKDLIQPLTNLNFALRPIHSPWHVSMTVSNPCHMSTCSPVLCYNVDVFLTWILSCTALWSAVAVFKCALEIN